MMDSRSQLIEYPFNNTVLWNVPWWTSVALMALSKKIRPNATFAGNIHEQISFQPTESTGIINQVQSFVTRTKQWLLIYDAGNVERIPLLTFV